MPSADELNLTSNGQRAELSRGAFWAGLGALVLFYLAFSTYQLSAVPLIDPDEPRYASAGRTMARGGSLLVPEFNGEKRINKPPLYYWLVATSMKLTGNEMELGARLPSIALGLVMLLGTVAVGARIYGLHTGLLAGGILATTVLFVALSRSCVTDMALSTFLSLALGLLLLAVLKRGPPRWLFWAAMFSLGLAVLCKATPALCFFAVLILYRFFSLPRSTRAGNVKPILVLFGLALIFSAIALYCSEQQISPAERAKLTAAAVSDAKAAHALRAADLFILADHILNAISLLLAAGAIVQIVWLAYKAGAGGLRGFPWITAVPLALAMGAWWYLALIQRFGLTEFLQLIEFEVAERMAGNVHREGMHYYIENIFPLFLPWAMALPGLLHAAWPSEKPVEGDSDARHADRYLLAWALGVTLFFSVPGAKLATYILPAFPALALMAARFILRWNSTEEPLSAWVKRWTVYGTLLFLGVLGLAGFVPVSYPDDFNRFVQALALPLGVLGAGYAVALGLAAWLLPRRPVTGTFVAYAASFAFVAAAAHAAFPVFLYGRSARSLCLEAREQLAGCQRFVSMGADRESLSFYADRTIVEARRRNADENETLEAVVREELARPERTALFIHRKYYGRMVGLNSKKLPRDNAPLRELAPDFAVFVGANEQMVLLLPKGDKK